jgi:hypothetical protein
MVRRLRNAAYARGRIKAIARMLPARPLEIAQEWQHFYPNYAAHSASARMLHRDLKRLGARSERGIWVTAA